LSLTEWLPGAIAPVPSFSLKALRTSSRRCSADCPRQVQSQERPQTREREGVLQSLESSTRPRFCGSASRLQSLAGYLAMHALAGLLILTAWLMSEPSRWAERPMLRAGDRALFFMTMILTVASNLTIAIPVGTFAGLALRLVRKEVEPEEWSPVDRSKLGRW
jgi:hypothetical protein